jgi:ubiquinone/menaquinone biosynthesis C-methylase UbiE
MFLWKMLSRKNMRSMDPLHVSMTGVRMGERFLQIGCDDKALLAGLAAKVGLSGNAAAAVFDEDSAKRAEATQAKVGALIDVQRIDGNSLPFDGDSVDLIVIDDTRGSFAARSKEQHAAILIDARRVVRGGGRIEIIEREARPEGYDSARDLSEAGFKPVRELAVRDGFRFVEGLKS